MKATQTNYDVRQKEVMLAVKAGTQNLQSLPRWSPVRVGAGATQAVYVLWTHSEDDEDSVTRNVSLCFCPRDQTMQVAVFSQDGDVAAPARFVAEFAKFDLYPAVNRFFAMVDRIGEIDFPVAYGAFREPERA